MCGGLCAPHLPGVLRARGGVGGLCQSPPASPAINLRDCGLSPPVSGCHSVPFADLRSDWCPLCHGGMFLPPPCGVRGPHPAQCTHHKGRWYFHISLMVRERAGTTHPHGLEYPPGDGAPPQAAAPGSRGRPQKQFRGEGAPAGPHHAAGWVSVGARGPRGSVMSPDPSWGSCGGLRRAAQVSRAPHHPLAPRSLRARPPPPPGPGPPLCPNPL